MGLMREIFNALKTYSSIFTFAVIAMADYIWEDKYFTCPCVNTGLRAAYSVAFVLSPAFFLLLADSNCRVLCITCKNCLIETYCGIRAGFARPCILAGAWVIYSVMDPRFSDCIAHESFNRIKQRNCTEEDRFEGKMKSYFAIAILCVSVVALILAIVFGCCRGCSGFSRKACWSNWRKKCSKSCKTCCCKKCSFEMLTKEERLTEQTMIILDQENLLEDYFFRKFDDSDFVKLENKITMGQLICLKEHCEQLNSQTQGSGEGNAANIASAADPSASSSSCFSCCSPISSTQRTAGTSPAIDQPASSSAGPAADSPASNCDEGPAESQEMNSPTQGSGEVNAEGTPSAIAQPASSSAGEAADFHEGQFSSEPDEGSELLRYRGIQMLRLDARSASKNSVTEM